MGCVRLDKISVLVEVKTGHLWFVWLWIDKYSIHKTCFIKKNEKKEKKIIVLIEVVQVLTELS